jgi:hypothetical protein
MTFWYTQRIWKNMRNTFVSCFNDYESTSYTPSSASASSRLMKYHSWVTWYHQKESWWTPASTRCVELEATNVYNSSTKFSWVGWLLSKVHSELLQDCEADHRALEEGNQVCLERRVCWCISSIEEIVNYITSASVAQHRQVFQRILWCF